MINEIRRNRLLDVEFWNRSIVVDRPKKYYLYIVYHKYPVVDIARIHKGFKFIGRISDRETTTDDFVWEQISSGHFIWSFKLNRADIYKHPFLHDIKKKYKSYNLKTLSYFQLSTLDYGILRRNYNIQYILF